MLIAAIAGFSYFRRIKALRQELLNEIAKVHSLQLQNALLDEAIKGLEQGSELKELEARKKWGLIKPGEKYYQVNPKLDN